MQVPTTKTQRTYTYNLPNGKIRVGVREYTVKHPDTLRSIENKEKFENYINEHIIDLQEIPRHKWNTYIIKKAKDELNLEVSQCGARKVLNKIISEEQ